MKLIYNPPMQNFICVLITLKYVSYIYVNASVFTEEVFDVIPNTRILYDYVTDVLLENSGYGCAAICHGNTYCNGASYNSKLGICEISTTSYPGDRENDSDWTVFVSTGDAGSSLITLSLMLAGSTSSSSTQPPTTTTTTTTTTTSATTTTTVISTESPFFDCKDIFDRHESSPSGVYTVLLSSLNMWKSVYCDMETDGGGWTVFQKRQDGAVFFNKTFSEYQYGFGDQSSSYWIGLDVLHTMTASYDNDLEIQFVDFNGGTAYEKYDNFKVGAGVAYALSLGNLTFFNDTQGTSFYGTYTDGQTMEVTCQYIDSVLDFSAQMGSVGFTAQQVIGDPDVYPNNGELVGSWNAGYSGTQNEYLELQIAQPVLITNVTIYETCDAGSLTRIASRDNAGQWQTLWSSSQTQLLSVSRMFSPELSTLKEMTTDIRLEVDASITVYSIDAVQVCGVQDMAPYQTMKYNDKASFTTKDNDQDENAGNCADIHKGGWWFKNCTAINPNGRYFEGGDPFAYTTDPGGMIVPGWKGYESMKQTKFMFRRKT